MAEAEPSGGRSPAPVPAQLDAPAQPGAAPDPEKGGNGSFPALDHATVVPADPWPAADPGELLAADVKPRQLPADLAARLNQRELRTVWQLVAGLDYQAALTASGVKPRAAVRDAPPPPQVEEAVRWVIADLAEQCGLSRKWILTNAVALFRRAVRAEPVLDRKGKPTGEWRHDGATAARMLELLGKANGAFADQSRGKLGISEVAQLLAAVAAGGKPPLDARRSPGGAWAVPPAVPAPAPADAAPAQPAIAPRRDASASA